VGQQQRNMNDDEGSRFAGLVLVIKKVVGNVQHRVNHRRLRMRRAEQRKHGRQDGVVETCKVLLQRALQVLRHHGQLMPRHRKTERPCFLSLSSSPISSLFLSCDLHGRSRRGTAPAEKKADWRSRWSASAAAVTPRPRKGPANYVFLKEDKEEICC
jgi:hypothetical protein